MRGLGRLHLALVAALLAGAPLSACNALSGVSDFDFASSQPGTGGASGVMTSTTGTTTSSTTTAASSGQGGSGQGGSGQGGSGQGGSGQGGSGQGGGSATSSTTSSTTTTSSTSGSGGAGGAAGCDATQKNCNGVCVSQDDPAFGCAAVGCAPCAMPHATAACGGFGQCVVGLCDQGWGDCTAAAGCETDVRYDPKRCGGCNTICGKTEYCNDQVCECRPGLTLVGASCVDLLTNPQNCGMIGKVCGGATPYCDQGLCVAACSAGTTPCAFACVDKMRDELHCGSCQKVCPTETVCAAGQCEDYSVPVGCVQCPCGCADVCCTMDPSSLLICISGPNVCP